MDLLEVIKKQLDHLPQGPHSPGLGSVLRHIEVAYRHLSRGESQADDSAFTDAIYRTNQAFEGSIKEAYRVLAEKNPASTTPFQIEQYLEDRKVFPSRVLTQFTNYRTQWRNPSTHDYNLDFGATEAFLAIVSVSAFAKLLVDQIAQRFSFIAATKDVHDHKVVSKERSNSPQRLAERVLEIFQEFVRHYATHNADVPIETEVQLVGALGGFLSSVAPDLRVSMGRVFRNDRPYYIDMLVEDASNRVVVELKRGQHRALVEGGTEQLYSYLAPAEAMEGILFLYSSKATKYRVDVRRVGAPTSEPSGRIRTLYILRPLTTEG